MPQMVSMSCWACGLRMEYDCLKVSYPRGWAEVAVAGGAHDFCDGCSPLRTSNDGRGWSHVLLNRIKAHRGIDLDREGNTLATQSS